MWSACPDELTWLVVVPLEEDPASSDIASPQARDDLSCGFAFSAECYERQVAGVLVDLLPRDTRFRAAAGLLDAGPHTRQECLGSSSHETCVHFKDRFTCHLRAAHWQRTLLLGFPFPFATSVLGVH
jgi:hypothetical protein